jgi:hypothetical protein
MSELALPLLGLGDLPPVDVPAAASGADRRSAFGEKHLLILSLTASGPLSDSSAHAEPTVPPRPTPNLGCANS